MFIAQSTQWEQYQTGIDEAAQAIVQMLDKRKIKKRLGQPLQTPSVPHVPVREKEAIHPAEARLSDLQSRLNLAEARATEAESQLSAAKTQASEAESKLGKAEARASEAETKIAKPKGKGADPQLQDVVQYIQTDRKQLALLVEKLGSALKQRDTVVRTQLVEIQKLQKS